MKIIGSVKEDLSFEKRISMTPEVVKKFTNLQHAINLGVKKFKNQVKLKKYPTKKYSY